MTSEEFLNELNQFLNRHILPYKEAIEQSTCFPREYLSALGALQAYGVTVPTAYGGLGFPPIFLKSLVYKIALLSPLLSLTMGIPVLTAYIIAKYGQGEQLHSLLPRLCRGEAFCAFAYTEAGQSGARSGFLTRASSTGDGYQLQGEKNMISWGGEADYYLTVATLEIDKKTTRPTAFIVSKKIPGITFGDISEKMAFPGLVLQDVYFKDVQLSANGMLGHPGIGLKIANEALQLGRLCVTSVALAIAQSSWDDCRQHVMCRRLNGKRLADFQSVQFTLVEMKLALEACRLLVDTAWQQWADDAPDKSMSIAVAKVYAARMVMKLADQALQLYGGAGYLQGSAIERRFRQARLFSLIEGTSETMLNVIANRVLSDG